MVRLISRRLAKLEKRLQPATETLTIFRVAVTPNPGGDPIRSLCGASVTGGPSVERQKDEAEGQFLMRFYAATAPDKPTEKMTENEINHVRAASDPELALARYREEPVS